MKTNIIIGMCIAIALLTAGSASAWLDNYEYRQSINLTGASDGAQTDYQIKLSIPYTAAMQGDFDDVRFTQDDGDTLIDAWLETKIDDTSAEVWAEFPTTPANGVNQTYYMYYGNDAAASNWDGPATFPNLFDDFADGDYASDPVWTVYRGGWSASAYRLDHLTGFSGYGAISTPSTAAYGAWEWDVRLAALNSNYYVITCFISANASDSNADGNYDVYMRGDGLLKMRKRAGGTSTELLSTTWSADANIHTVKVTRDAGNQFRLYIDDVLKGAFTDGTTTTSSYFLLFEKSDNDVDAVFNHKHTNNPATYAFGSEESPSVYDPPSIVAYNNITGDRAHIPIDHDTPVLFSATAGPGITWSWTLDGVDQSTSYDNYNHTFSSGFGYYDVTVTATNPLGTDTYTWGIWENIETTAETIPTFTDTSYQMLLDSIDYPPDMEEFGKAMAHPFVQMVGVIFYLFIFGIPLLMMYIRQDNMTMPTTLLLLFGSIIIFMLPPQWQIIAGALMTLGFVGILFKLYKERER